jgi:hypothetical protein
MNKIRQSSIYTLISLSIYSLSIVIYALMTGGFKPVSNVLVGVLFFVFVFGIAFTILNIGVNNFQKFLILLKMSFLNLVLIITLSLLLFNYPSNISGEDYFKYLRIIFSRYLLYVLPGLVFAGLLLTVKLKNDKDISLHKMFLYGWASVALGVMFYLSQYVLRVNSAYYQIAISTLCLVVPSCMFSVGFIAIFQRRSLSVDIRKKFWIMMNLLSTLLMTILVSTL